MKTPKPPAQLGPEGRALWRSIVSDAAAQGVELDSREIIYLRESGKLADTIARMERELSDADLTTAGYKGQPVSNPILSELRMHRQLLAQTVARIRVDVPEESSNTGAPNRFRAAAETRWSNR